MGRIVHIHHLLEHGDIVFGNIAFLLESHKYDSEGASDHLLALRLIDDFGELLVEALGLRLAIQDFAANSMQESDLVHCEALRGLY